MIGIILDSETGRIENQQQTGNGKLAVDHAVTQLRTCRCGGKHKEEKQGQAHQQKPDELA